MVIATCAVGGCGYDALVVGFIRFGIRKSLGLVPEFVELFRPVSFTATQCAACQRTRLGRPGRPGSAPTSSVILDQKALLTYLVLPWSLMTSLPNFLLTLSWRCNRLPELELNL